MRTAADTSVVVPALLEEHAHHTTADAGLAGTDCSILQVALESYSVMTRLPGPMRVLPAPAARALAQRLPGRLLSFHSTGLRALELLAEVGISAGASYDGVIALTAREHGVRLISRDRRAARTYAAVGASFELL